VYEEFETGPWSGNSEAPKRSWGGIPDMWFTSEVLNLLREVLLHEEEEADGGGSLRLFHGAPATWRRGDGLSMRGMPTGYGVSLSVTVVFVETFRHFSGEMCGNTPSVAPSIDS
jgi:hypothetical protein